MYYNQKKQYRYFKIMRACCLEKGTPERKVEQRGIRGTCGYQQATSTLNHSRCGYPHLQTCTRERRLSNHILPFPVVDVLLDYLKFQACSVLNHIPFYLPRTASYMANFSKYFKDHLHFEALLGSSRQLQNYKYVLMYHLTELDCGCPATTTVMVSILGDVSWGDENGKCYRKIRFEIPQRNKHLGPGQWLWCSDLHAGWEKKNAENFNSKVQ